jgi:hypothetical protein
MEIDARAGNLLRWRGARAKKVWVGFSAPEVKGGAGVARRRPESPKAIYEFAGSIKIAEMWPQTPLYGKLVKSGRIIPNQALFPP